MAGPSCGKGQASQAETTLTNLRFFGPLVSNLITPSFRANRVWSRPRPTPTPAWNLVPRWRTMMLPAVTAWPPNSLTPRRLDSESRPLRVEPAAFLCAMDNSSVQGMGRLRGDPGDLDFGEPLTVALTLHAVLATTELDDGHLVAAAVGDDLGRDLGTRSEERRVGKECRSRWEPEH